MNPWHQYSWTHNLLNVFSVSFWFHAILRLDCILQANLQSKDCMAMVQTTNHDRSNIIQLSLRKFFCNFRWKRCLHRCTWDTCLWGDTYKWPEKDEWWMKNKTKSRASTVRATCTYLIWRRGDVDEEFKKSVSVKTPERTNDRQNQMRHNLPLQFVNLNTTRYKQIDNRNSTQCLIIHWAEHCKSSNNTDPRYPRHSPPVILVITCSTRW